MVRFYTYGDAEAIALIRRADAGDAADVPTWSFFDRKTGAWVEDPEIGRPVVDGEAESIDELAAKRLEAKLRGR